MAVMARRTSAPTKSRRRSRQTVVGERASHYSPYVGRDTDCYRTVVSRHAPRVAALREANTQPKGRRVDTKTTRALEDLDEQLAEVERDQATLEKLKALVAEVDFDCSIRRSRIQQAKMILEAKAESPPDASLPVSSRGRGSCLTDEWGLHTGAPLTWTT